MTLLQAIVLGIVQGLTELLPVSSSGHLAIVPRLFGWDDTPIGFAVAVHLGTLCAVLVYFRNRIMRILRGVWWRIRANAPSDIEARDAVAQTRYAWMVILSMTPAVVAAVLFEDVVERTFGDTRAVGGFLIVTAVILWASERSSKRTKSSGTGRRLVSWVDALAMGLAQAFALFPGLSRSGATIGAGLLRGLTPVAAVRFAFLMSIPVIFGGGLYEALKAARNGFGDVDVLLYLIGAIAAALSTWVAIVLVFRAVRRGKLVWFSVYCGLVGLLCLTVGLPPA